MNFNDLTKIKTGFFHALGYVLTKFTNAPMNELYKSSHNIKTDEVWADAINFCSDFNTAETEAISNEAVTEIGNITEKALMYPLRNSDRQAWFIDTGTPTFDTNGFIPSINWVKPLISPVDVTNSAGAPSLGFKLRMFTPSGSEIDPGSGRWEIDYYAGIIKFQEGFTPTDTGNGLGFQFDANDFLTSVDKTNYLEVNGPRAIAFKYSGDYLNNKLTGDEPTLIDPSFSFSIDKEPLQEIGASMSIGLSSSFYRGSIDPEYTSGSPYRAGTPISYSYVGYNLNSSYSSTYSTDNRTVLNYIVQDGYQEWTSTVNFEEGVQPKNSSGGDYEQPYPGGSMSATSSIYGVYPAYATSNDITIFEKQELAYPNDPIYINLTNDLNDDKQTFRIPSSLTITGVQQELFLDFEWIWGNKTQSLEYINNNFIKTTIYVDVNSNELGIEYFQYEYSGPRIGKRKLKLYFE